MSKGRAADGILLDDRALAEAITSSTDQTPVETTLRTDERVLARVTDGIYRQPGSALRELISNAYDADAQSVIIKMDRPRFDRITIEDDGTGMTPAALARLVHHIGGSAKRTTEGAELGITDDDDPLRSPGGRRLIGRIGIGLFSVAQLTQRFQIITKVKGDAFRTVATVVLRQYSDDAADDDVADDGQYEAGRVNIWREPAVDVEKHGTTIVLTDLRPQTRDTLRSLDLWSAIDSDATVEPDESRNLEPPRFHIGRVDPAAPDLLRADSSESFNTLPWERNDPPDVAFDKLVHAVWDESRLGTPNPQLDRIFDYYLRMVWQLSLAVPAPYVEGHPFDLALADSSFCYELSPATRLVPRELRLSGTRTLREELDLPSAGDEGEDFKVIIDDLLLRRPLRFTDLPATSHQVKKPIIFGGYAREEFSGVPLQLSGGPLEFSAYLMWAPKIVPTEHQGVLIRIHGASGTLFDPTFLRYQVSEQTRLRQITCEIFVTAGLEGALNIDRESFNYAHPHVVYITKWLHVALRKLASVQKKISADIREAARREAATQQDELLTSIVHETWRRASADEGRLPTPVKFTTQSGAVQDSGEGYRFNRSRVLGSVAQGWGKRNRAVETKLRAILQVLAAYEVLDRLDEADQEDLAISIRRILEAEEA